MRRRRFLKAVLGAGVAVVIPIPVPAGPKPLTFGVVGEAIKRTVEKADFCPVVFGWTPVFDLDYPFTGTLKHQNGFTK